MHLEKPNNDFHSWIFENLSSWARISFFLGGKKKKGSSRDKIYLHYFVNLWHDPFGLDISYCFSFRNCKLICLEDQDCVLVLYWRVCMCEFLVLLWVDFVIQSKSLFSGGFGFALIHFFFLSTDFFGSCT